MLGIANMDQLTKRCRPLAEPTDFTMGRLMPSSLLHARAPMSVPAPRLPQVPSSQAQR